MPPPPGLSLAEILAIAKSYPYENPQASYLYRDGVGHDLEPDAVDLRLWRRQDRVPVVAYGANRAVSALARKFAGWPEGTEIPVAVAWAEDLDVTFSAHITSYGSLPARIERTPGTRVQIAVNFLTPAQLARMHETEGPMNYRFRPMETPVRLPDGSAITGAFAYHGVRPSVREDGRPVAIASLPAEGRVTPAWRQIEAITHARDVLARDLAIDTFIAQNIACRITRLHRLERLSRHHRV
ncbi:MAG: hypothetical protein RLO50_18150 [Azospirillaceae bacterium]